MLSVPPPFSSMSIIIKRLKISSCIGPRPSPLSFTIYMRKMSKMFVRWTIPRVKLFFGFGRIRQLSAKPALTNLSIYVILHIYEYDIVVGQLNGG